ncbi:hypothetical protein RsTz2092_13640 [Deferribacterales bacterium RsTz2092]|nr:hypothetical protein AGMMS49941_12860 [Deferribacterales bacterium]
MRNAFIIILLTLSAATFAAGSDSDGFRGIAWGSSAAQTPGLTPADGYKNGVSAYRLNNERLDLNGIPLESVLYLFKDGLFYSVRLGHRDEYAYQINAELKRLVAAAPPDSPVVKRIIPMADKREHLIITNANALKPTGASGTSGTTPAGAAPTSNANSGGSTNGAALASNANSAGSTNGATPTNKANSDGNTNNGYAVELVIDGVESVVAFGGECRLVAGSRITFKRLLLNGQDMSAPLNFKGWYPKDRPVNTGDDRDIDITIKPKMMIPRYNLDKKGQKFPVKAVIGGNETAIIYIILE